jgi:hypothetical protein
VGSGASPQEDSYTEKLEKQFQESKLLANKALNEDIFPD